MEKLASYVDTNLVLVLILVSIICAILWGLLYYSSAWFKKKIADKLNDKIITCLKHRFFKNVASFFINGGLHFVVLLITLMSIAVLFKLSMSGNPEPNKIQLVFTRNSSIDEPYQSFLQHVDLKLILNSDTLYKKSGKKGSSGISINYYTEEQDSVDYGLVYLAWNKQDSSSVFRDENKYVEKPKYEVFQSTLNSSAISIIPAKRDFPGAGHIFKEQEMTIVNNSWAPVNDNPYYYYYLTLNIAEARWINHEAFMNRDDYNISIEIQIGDLVENDTITIVKENSKIIGNKDSVIVDTVNFPMPTVSMTNKNLKFTYINPIPDAITNGIIKFTSKQTIEKILKGEYITIQAEDIDVMKKKNQESLLWTILLGMCVGFLLDVIIQQIRELRNINRKKEEQEEQNEVVQEECVSEKCVDATETPDDESPRDNDENLPLEELSASEKTNQNDSNES